VRPGAPASRRPVYEEGRRREEHAGETPALPGEVAPVSQLSTFDSAEKGAAD